MKKIRVLALVAFVLIVFAGCSGALHDAPSATTVKCFNNDAVALISKADGKAEVTTVTIKYSGLDSKWIGKSVGLVGTVNGWDPGNTMNNVPVNGGSFEITFEFADEEAQIQVIEANAGWVDGNRPIGDGNLVISAEKGKHITYIINI